MCNVPDDVPKTVYLITKTHLPVRGCVTRRLNDSDIPYHQVPDEMRQLIRQELRYMPNDIEDRIREWLNGLEKDNA